MFRQDAKKYLPFSKPQVSKSLIHNDCEFLNYLARFLLQFVRETHGSTGIYSQMVRRYCGKVRKGFSLLLNR
jgi:hypothetical protein